MGQVLQSGRLTLELSGTLKLQLKRLYSLVLSSLVVGLATLYAYWLMSPARVAVENICICLNNIGSNEIL